MKRNMSKLDRIIRGIVGVVLAWVGIMYLGIWWGIVLLIVGLILIITAIIGWCPLYALFKFSTLKK